jgi:hypothetical protein
MRMNGSRYLVLIVVVVIAVGCAGPQAALHEAIKASPELLANLTVIGNEPVRLSGREGFRVRAQYKNKRGLPVDLVVWGVADKSGYSTIRHNAPSLYYFDHYLPDVERMVASFRLTSAGRSAGLYRGVCYGDCG